MNIFAALITYGGWKNMAVKIDSFYKNMILNNGKFLFKKYDRQKYCGICEKSQNFNQNNIHE